MKRIFPMYKGKSLDKAGMGYANVKSARQYMNDRPVREGFDKTLPKDYWYQYEYVYKHNKERHDNEIGSTGYKYHDTDYEEKFFIKDLTGKVKEVCDKIYAIENKYRARGWGLAGDNVVKTMEGLLVELDKLGWYYVLFDDMTDYWKRYRKYLKENVEFVEKEVSINVEG